jgi:hypothetical protein
VSQDSFENECDRLSKFVDGMLFERLRWERTEAPMLARLVELAKGAVESRPDFELTEEGATNDIRRYVVKVHSNRTVAITISLDGTRAVMNAQEVERSRYKLAPGEPISAEFATVDEQWMAATLGALFSRVRG